jgi:AmmeMemoRadiSam system protein A
MTGTTLSTDRVRALLERHGPPLLRLAAASIHHTLTTGEAMAVDLPTYDRDLHEPGASFVTLRRQGELRGCIGSSRAWRPLVVDIAGNGAAAAVEDPRFKPLQAHELNGLWLSISVLTSPELITATSEAELLPMLRPGQDGLILAEGPKTAVLLPQVWEWLPSPATFVAALKEKAGLATDHWSTSLRVLRFESVTIEDSDLFNA